jgi:polyvinyl alcohol dehydrogenase (cytochrome)
MITARILSGWVTSMYLLALVPTIAAQTASTGIAGFSQGNYPPNGALRLFQSHCATCHGSSNVQAPDLSALMKLTPEEILNALTIGPMSTQAQGLSEVEKRGIAEVLGGRPPGIGEAGDAKSMSNRCSSDPPLTDPSAGPAWNGWGVDAANTRFQSEKVAGITAAQVPSLKLKWAFGFPNGIDSYDQATIASGRVFVGSDNGYVYSLNATTGCLYWSFRAASGVRAAISIGPVENPRLTKFSVYFGDMRGNVYALDAANGQLLWKTHVEDHPLARITGAPKLYKNYLYVPVSSFEEPSSSYIQYPCCTFRGSVVALDTKTGRQVWKTYTISETPAQTRKNSLGTQLWAPAGAAIWSSPTIDPKRNALYVGTGDGYTEPAAKNSDSIMALDLNSGRILWSVQDTEGDSWLAGCDSDPSDNCPKHLGPDYDFGSSPILRTLPDGHQVIVAAQKSGNVFAHDPDHQGALLWKTNLSETPPPTQGLIVFGGAADDQNAYFPLATGGAAAVPLSTGGRRWLTRFEMPDTDSSGKPRPHAQTAAASAMPGIVFMGGWDGVLRALSTTDGETVWEYDTVRKFETVNGVAGSGGSMGSAGPTIAGGMLFVSSGYFSNRGAGYAGNVLLAFGLD